VLYVNQVGDAVAHTVLDMVNPVKQAKTAWADAHESVEAYRTGHFFRGVGLMGVTALDLAGVLPAERAIVNGVQYGYRGISAVGSRLGFFGGRSVTTKMEIPNKSTFFKSAGTSPKNLTQIPHHKFKLWHDYLTKRGVRFEISTEKAHQVLSDSGARGMFESTLIDIDTNTFSRTIYLPKDFHPSAFYEESIHALDSLKRRPQFMMHEGRVIDAFEYRAKKMLMSAAPKRFDYDEFILLEKHMQAVLKGKY
jgi:hypothetical protein